MQQRSSRESCIQMGFALVALPQFHFVVLCFWISPFTNGPTTNETIQKSSSLRQKLCSLLSKVRRWLLQRWKALAAKLLPLGLPSKTKSLLPLMKALSLAETFEGPCRNSQVFLDEINYMRFSHLAYEPMTV